MSISVEKWSGSGGQNPADWRKFIRGRCACTISAPAHEDALHVDYADTPSTTSPQWSSVRFADLPCLVRGYEQERWPVPSSQQ